MQEWSNLRKNLSEVLYWWRIKFWELALNKIEKTSNGNIDFEQWQLQLWRTKFSEWTLKTIWEKTSNESIDFDQGLYLTATTLKKQILRITFWSRDVLRVATQSKTVDYCLVILVFKVLKRRTRTKCSENVADEKMFCKLKQWWFLFEKHLNEEEEIVIENWGGGGLINKINSRMLASFSTKPRMNDTSHCCSS